MIDDSVGQAARIAEVGETELLVAFELMNCVLAGVHLKTASNEPFRPGGWPVFAPDRTGTIFCNET